MSKMAWPNGDPRPKRHGWAPGNYMGPCYTCDEHFIGDKRSRMCADCAYALPDDAVKPKGMTIEQAFAALKNGRGIRRSGWPAGEYVQVCVPFDPKADGSNRSSYLVRIRQPVGGETYSPEVGDLHAEDWEILA